MSDEDIAVLVKVVEILMDQHDKETAEQVQNIIDYYREIGD